MNPKVIKGRKIAGPWTAALDGSGTSRRFALDGSIAATVVSPRGWQDGHAARCKRADLELAALGWRLINFSAAEAPINTEAMDA